MLMKQKIDKGERKYSRRISRTSLVQGLEVGKLQTALQQIEGVKLRPLVTRPLRHSDVFIYQSHQGPEDLRIYFLVFYEV